MTDPRLTTALLNELSNGTAEDAVAILRAQSLLDVETLLALAIIALEEAESQPKQVARWLATCRAGNQSLQSNRVHGQVAYAQARLDVQSGDLAAAESNILQAQQAWQRDGLRDETARSNIGLTQILAMQGRYAEAEVVIAKAVEHFEEVYRTAMAQSVADAFLPSLRLIGARRNLANLYSYQEKHETALAEFAFVVGLIDSLQQQFAEESEEFAAFQVERAHVAISQSLSHSHLDQIDQAESTLKLALVTFEQAEDTFFRGQIYGNLGSLYLRTGQFADALASFEEAGRAFKLLNNNDLASAVEMIWDLSLTQLEQATAYIALNLLPEAEELLKRCEIRFRSAENESGQSTPQELGSTLYMLSQVYARSGDLQRSVIAIEEAAQLFASIQNSFWANRCKFALAANIYHQGALDASGNLLETLLADVYSDTIVGEPQDAMVADANLRVNVLLLLARVYIESGEIGQAQLLLTRADSLVAWLDGFSNLQLLVLHARGRLEQAQGNLDKAYRIFLSAIDLLEAMRSTLLVEEVRSAFVIDKTDLYADLILNLLAAIDADTAADDLGDSSSELVAETFAMIERARSRTLLERLLATLSDDETEPNTSVDDGEQEHFSQRKRLRQELHWLYNRLLGQDGVRRIDVGLSKQIEDCEQALQKLEWQTSPSLRHVEPVELTTLQQSLAPDQQALVYYIAKNEVMAFVVDQAAVTLVRHLCTRSSLESALRDLRFQLGRFQLGEAYAQRHAERLQRGMLDTLQTLYHLLIEPLRTHMTMPRVQIIPFGVTHLVPFHALHDGKEYVIEHVECSYSPSASIAVNCHASTLIKQPLTSLAALGLTDELIPAANVEVERVVQHFDQSTSYVNDQANRANLFRAASEADILHIATHGLYRSDNPFFSSLKLADGWIDVREIYRLPLQARFVVLSACESGSLHVQDGDEVIGLARGFLGAGAQSLLVSLWTVHDATAAQQMDRFYHALQNDPACVRPAAALRKAQTQAIEDGLHPYYWAPFTLIG